MGPPPPHDSRLLWRGHFEHHFQGASLLVRVKLISSSVPEVYSAVLFRIKMASTQEKLDVSQCEIMAHLVEKLTTTGRPTLDQEQMKAFKKICK